MAETYFERLFPGSVCTSKTAPGDADAVCVDRGWLTHPTTVGIPRTMPVPCAETGGCLQTTGTPEAVNTVGTQQSGNGFQTVVDWAYKISSLLRTGGSANVTVGPYLSDVQVAPATPPVSSMIPLLFVGALAIGGLVVLLGD